MPPQLPDDEFARLFAEGHRRVFRFIHSLVPHRDDAEDVFQETSVVMWREAANFTPGTSFTSWALSIAFNQVRSYRHRSRRNRLVFSDALLEQLAIDENLKADEMEQRSQALEQCLNRLPAIDAQVVCAYYETRTTVIEVARKLNRPENTIYKALQRIRQTLRRCITASLAREK